MLCNNFEGKHEAFFQFDCLLFSVLTSVWFTYSYNCLDQRICEAGISDLFIGSSETLPQSASLRVHMDKSLLICHDDGNVSGGDFTFLQLLVKIMVMVLLQEKMLLLVT